MNFIDYILDSKNNGIIYLKIIPNARKTEFIEIMSNGVIKIKIAAVPEKWKANKELLQFLKITLSLHKDSISIIWWQKSQIKKIKIDIWA